MSNSILQAGLKGIQAGLATAAEGARKTSRAFTAQGDPMDAVDGAIDMHEGKRLVQASSKIIKASEDMDQAILDILA